MTIAPEEKKEARPVPEGHVRLTIDGIEVDAPKGEILIRTCERLGIIVPRFCDHPLLDPAGACRQCLVEVEMGGRPMPKPQASCTMTVADGMVVKTQHSSPVAKKAQEGVMELLLINHPLDFEGAAAAGSMLGTTAVMVFNETVSVPWAVMKWTEFYKHESCGKCTPCREGTFWLVQILERMVHGEGTEADVETMLDICDNILGRSFCALGDGATSPITSAIKYFRQEFLDLIAEQPAVQRPEQLDDLVGAQA